MLVFRNTGKVVTFMQLQEELPRLGGFHCKLFVHV